MNHSDWIERTSKLAERTERERFPLDFRAWDENENTTIDLIKFEYGLYEEPTKDWGEYL